MKLRCPKCGMPTIVIDTKHSDQLYRGTRDRVPSIISNLFNEVITTQAADHDMIYRYRRCTGCHHSFATTEMTEFDYRGYYA